MPYESQPTPWHFTRTDIDTIEKAVADCAVNHPKHYTAHPSGVEVIRITEHMNFCLGNAVKYILRCDHKGKPIEDLEKALWYIEREIERREGQKSSGSR